MTHDTQKEIQKASLIGRILSMETFLLFMGIALLIYGVANSATMVIFWGCVIVPGVLILHQIRKRDWSKHWQEMEEEHKRQEAFEMRRKKVAEDARDSNGGK
ncbi:MAG: hypothetical protein PHI31_12420 [Desulfuromonadaceae bacterium]|nr:hypothetical protein [Desulfuromonadaceae bacterium]